MANGIHAGDPEAVVSAPPPGAPAPVTTPDDEEAARRMAEACVAAVDESGACMNATLVQVTQRTLVPLLATHTAALREEHAAALAAVTAERDASRREANELASQLDTARHHGREAEERAAEARALGWTAGVDATKAEYSAKLAEAEERARVALTRVGDVAVDNARDVVALRAEVARLTSLGTFGQGAEAQAFYRWTVVYLGHDGRQRTTYVRGTDESDARLAAAYQGVADIVRVFRTQRNGRVQPGDPQGGGRS